MKYILLLGFLLGCTESKSIDKHIKELNKATESLKFSTIDLECTMALNSEKLAAKRKRLSIPNTLEAAMVLIDAYIYECIVNIYKLGE